MSRHLTRTLLLTSFVGLFGPEALSAQVRRLDLQGGFVRPPGPAHRDPSLDAHGGYVGLRYSEELGPRARFLIAAGAMRIGGESSHTDAHYASYSMPLTGGVGYALRRSGPTIEVAFHAGFAREWRALPAGYTSEQLFGSTDAANPQWQQFMATELLLRHAFARGWPAMSVGTRLHHGSHLTPHPQVAFVLGVGLPR